MKQSLSIKTKTRFYYPKTPFISHLGTIQLDHLNQPVSDELKTKRKKICTLLKICVTEKCLLEFITCAFVLELGSLPKLSVAEVLFRTALENQNRQNQTVKFGSVLFSPRNSWSCLVLSSYIWEDIQNQVQTGSNRTSSDIILCFQTEAAVCLSECHLFFLFLFGQHRNRWTTLKPW